ncbi:hypothetical protein KQX54_014281 [Cotesia glomerata]|uniref:Uncharacterized protein n=1 Tax=Cotesia glomerata TaxID=32391 RepID=A0AAV7II54_COTGL|nr:hypothetical protein KQX54_014281 [Cotesia glomerata]
MAAPADPIGPLFPTTPHYLANSGHLLVGVQGLFYGTLTAAAAAAAAASQVPTFIAKPYPGICETIRRMIDFGDTPVSLGASDYSDNIAFHEELACSSWDKP